MTQPWTISTAWGPVRLDVAIAAAALVLLIALLAAWWRRSRQRSARDRGDGAAPSRATAGRGEPAALPSSFERIRLGLGKTREGLLGRLAPVLARRHLDQDALEDVETALLAADVGAGMTARLLQQIERAGEDSPRERLAREISTILASAKREHDGVTVKPHVIVVVGVNGVGKTTSIGKLAARYATEKKSVMLIAADTFRAAAIEQLGVWAERTGATLIRQQHGADPGAVVYDGVRAAIARGVDVAIVDTAGRLHTKSNLMEELRKVRRVIARELPGAPHETLLVLDAVTGQNGLAQARAFLQHLDVDGIVLTKLDGTAKGGIVIAIAGELGIPIRYVGVGEAVEDLRDFDPDEFVSALFASPNRQQIP